MAISFNKIQTPK